MIVYTKEHNVINKISLKEIQYIPENTIWIDLIDVTTEEEEKLEKILKVNIPTPEETQSIYISNRLYEENKAVYMSMTLYLAKNNNNIKILEPHTLTFVIVQGILITVRDFDDDSLYKSLISDEENYILENNISLSLLLIFLRQIINDASASLEDIGYNLDNQNKNILKNSTAKSVRNEPSYKNILKEIANIGNSVSKIRESLMTMSRMIIFLSQSSVVKNNDIINSSLKIFLKDIAALTDHSTFLSSQVSFLLDAILGLINIEQNSIIKIFSVLSVVFMPPTLIASIYGMNFIIMPELKWAWGYPVTIICMCISSWIPYKYFKRKKWL